MAQEREHNGRTLAPSGTLPSGKGRLGRLGPALAGTAAGLFVFVLYVRTLAPTVLYYDDPDMLDAVMLQMQVAVLGITHPTGYPTYLTLTHFFTYLPVGDVAYRVNLASAAYAALAVGVVFGAGYLLSRRVVAAAVAAVAFGLGGAIWSQAVIAEVYTMNALFIALTLVCLLLWRDRERDRYLLLAALLCGLCLTHHLTSGLLLPASLLFVGLVDRRRLLEWRLMLKCAGLFLLGLTPYLYLPIRSWMDAPMEANNPSNFERFWYVVSGGNLTGSFFAYGPAELPGRLLFYWGHLTDNINPVLVMVGLTGAALMVARDRPVGLLLGFLFLGWAFYSIENDIPDINLYFIPTYLVLCLWTAVGLGALLTEAEHLTERLPRMPQRAILVVLSVALLLIPLIGVRETSAANDMSEANLGRQQVDAIAEKAAPNATILHHRSSAWYLVLVERRRQDLTLVDPYLHNTEVEYADIVWPADLTLKETDRRYGTDDFSGVKAAKIAAQKGPVYVLDSEYIPDPKRYEAFGFEVREVEENILYKLTPAE
ncbi:protein O-mannosyl-transferase family [Rubrobacter tropicus]|uniref:protein O-mannosyl-transferase family n=1 Tax=Rubrobacter tropicus TaxID=2653851 RepID=UPI001D1970B0|nr:DUF2723 domain-containing protein [Rubrobacter tropicus]